MIRETVDVLVLGSGFAGSLAAMLLARIGRSVALVDRERHPRFAIGESSTPLADLALRDMALRYELPRLLPLTRYGDWKRTYPEVVCGLKRGFSYFLHRPGEEFHSDADHSRELLVAASSSDESSDTHWLRSDVDAFFAAEAATHGVRVLEGADLRPVGRSPWRWCGSREGEAVEITADFVIDATGPAGAVARHVGAKLNTSGFQTCSRTIFAHVAGLRRWGSVLAERGVPQTEHTFPCDAAALHHVIDEGWMWQLRFDNDVTSVGFVLNDDRRCTDAPAEWARLLSRRPSLARQFERTEIIAPEGGLRATGRLQRRWTPAAGVDWALLPGTAGFIDPLHSTGIAHSLFGVERLVAVFQQHWARDTLTRELAVYDATVQQELTLIDHLVAACYAARREFPAFVAAVMLAFAAITTCERRRIAGESPACLSADDPELSRALIRAARRLIAQQHRGDGAAAQDMVREAIRPWNQVGLLDARPVNMYRHTAPAEE